MFSPDDLVYADLRHPRTELLIDLLARTVYGDAVPLALERAGLNPGIYPLGTAWLAWTHAVPDAFQQGRLGALVDAVSELKPAFRRELDRRLEQAPGAGWYRHADPFAWCFVGPRTVRAVIDRYELRASLRQLARADYWVLVVHGPPRSGKSHTWLLLEHLRSAGGLAGHRFARVTTHYWTGEVTGPAFAESLAAKLGLDVDLTPSGELDDAWVRKFLDRLVGAYPDDGATRWIILDGLDRPGVQQSARDLARGLIARVEDAELPHTRLVVTGLDPFGLPGRHAVRVEEIPAIDGAVLRRFLADVAGHLGRDTTGAELDACVAEILGPGPQPPDLALVEESVVRLVTTRWVSADA
ncbi:hypothetical protein AB0M46_11225 [Dactylosporangium sp. NPDC051485]|uniref:hypothetical protein n=1 Tax=Dactylosporangium sp. NPDC051485 TaxID=3154846 RepID=UPI003437F09F